MMLTSFTAKTVFLRLGEFVEVSTTLADGARAEPPRSSCIHAEVVSSIRWLEKKNGGKAEVCIDLHCTFHALVRRMQC